MSFLPAWWVIPLVLSAVIVADELSSKTPDIQKAFLLWLLTAGAAILTGILAQAGVCK